MWYEVSSNLDLYTIIIVESGQFSCIPVAQRERFMGNKENLSRLMIATGKSGWSYFTEKLICYTMKYLNVSSVSYIRDMKYLICHFNT